MLIEAGLSFLHRTGLGFAKVALKLATRISRAAPLWGQTVRTTKIGEVLGLCGVRLYIFKCLRASVCLLKADLEPYLPSESLEHARFPLPVITRMRYKRSAISTVDFWVQSDSVRHIPFLLSSIFRHSTKSRAIFNSKVEITHHCLTWNLGSGYSAEQHKL